MRGDVCLTPCNQLRSLGRGQIVALKARRLDAGFDGEAKRTLPDDAHDRERGADKEDLSVT
jgi:hypothetical protein